MKKSFFWSMIIVYLVLVGCTKHETTLPGVDQNVYHIYMYNQKDYQFDVITYQMEDMTKQMLVKEIMSRYEKYQVESDQKNPLSGSISYTNLTITNRTLNINLSTDYYQVTALEDIIFRTAMIKSFSELELIDEVTFQIAGLPITDKSFTAIGAKKTEDVFEDIMAISKQQSFDSLTIYYMDKTSKKLVPMIETIDIDPMSSLEENLVRYILTVKSKGDYISVVPENVNVLNVVVDNNVCYVNLDETFTKAQAAKGVSGQATIYGIVNAITELSSINKVQFLIEGEISEGFRGEIQLNQVFDRRLDLITK